MWEVASLSDKTLLADVCCSVRFLMSALSALKSEGTGDAMPVLSKDQPTEPQHPSHLKVLLSIPFPEEQVKTCILLIQAQSKILQVGATI